MKKESKSSVDFSVEEKADAFDSISELYFDRNFGSTSKSDFETLLFSIYIEHLIKNGLPYDDYIMSKTLGITEKRVRALKERKQLKYPFEFDWKESFAHLVKNAKYDDVTKTVKLSIEDVNLLKEVRHFVSTKGWYDEVQLNPRLFQCKLDCFLMICTELDEITLTETDKANIRKLKTEGDETSAVQKILNGDLRAGLKELALKGSKKLLTETIGLFSSTSISTIALKGISAVIQAAFE